MHRKVWNVMKCYPALSQKVTLFTKGFGLRHRWPSSHVIGPFLHTRTHLPTPTSTHTPTHKPIHTHTRTRNYVHDLVIYQSGFIYLRRFDCPLWFIVNDSVPKICLVFQFLVVCLEITYRFQSLVHFFHKAYGKVIKYFAAV